MKASYAILANGSLVVSIVALIMAEYGLTSLLGNWHPTHETAIAFGVISIASSGLARILE
jgi:hypothetical protein